MGDSKNGTEVTHHFDFVRTIFINIYNYPFNIHKKYNLWLINFFKQNKRLIGYK